MQFNASIAAESVNKFFIDLANQTPIAQNQAQQAAVDMLYGQLQQQLINGDQVPLVVIGQRLKKDTTALAGGVWLGSLPINSAFMQPLKESGTGAYMGSIFVDGAFMVDRFGRQALFKRTSNNRYPIKPVSAFVNTTSTSADRDAAAAKYVDIFTQELDKS